MINGHSFLGGEGLDGWDEDGGVKTQEHREGILPTSDLAHAQNLHILDYICICMIISV